MIGITMSASDWHWMITLGNPAGLIADASPDNGQWIIDDEYNVHYKHVTDEEKEYFKMAVPYVQRRYPGSELCNADR